MRLGQKVYVNNINGWLLGEVLSKKNDSRWIYVQVHGVNFWRTRSQVRTLTEHAAALLAE